MCFKYFFAEGDTTLHSTEEKHFYSPEVFYSFYTFQAMNSQAVVLAAHAPFHLFSSSVLFFLCGAGWHFS